MPHFSSVYVVSWLLIGMLISLSAIVWDQHRAIESLRRTSEAMREAHVELGNRLGTIQQQTCFDALTGLRNYQMFQAKLATLLRGCQPLALIYIDLDGLKAVNDRHGHPAGDRMIRTAVRAIRAAVRRRADLDNLFRRGTAADEFFLIVERCRIDIAVQRAEQILVSLRTLGLTGSIGVAEWDGLATQTCEQMECDAEQAMHCAKRDGRNCVRSCSVIEHTVPAAVPIAIPTEQTKRHAA